MSHFMPCLSKPKARFVAAIIAAATVTTACQEPKVYDTRDDIYPAPNADTYELDVYLLSEWSGSVVPKQQKIDLDIVFDPPNCAIAIKNEAKSNGFYCLDEQLSPDALIDSSNITEFLFYPYGYNSEIPGARDIYYRCECESDATEGDKPDEPGDKPDEPGENNGESGENNGDSGENNGESGDKPGDSGNNPDESGNESGENNGESGDKPGDSGENNGESGDKTDPTAPDPDKQPSQAPRINDSRRCTCETYMSGSAAVKSAWENILGTHDGRPSIRLGSGDTFGVSDPVSREFDDYPTIQAMNLLDFNVDTFGNHNFDNGLEYLQHVIDDANWQYTCSNLYNVPNNLIDVAPYALVEVEAKDAQSASKKAKPENLRVAVIGALDPEAASTISRGVFGTLDVKDYCPVINALEETYNKNARAFILLPHLTKESSTLPFLATIAATLDPYFSGDDELSDKENEKLIQKQKAALEEYMKCQSRLHITSSMLQEYKQFSKTKNDDGSNKTDKDYIAEITAIMRKEIFNNILFVMGPANANPFLMPIDKIDLYNKNETSNEEQNSLLSFLSEKFEKQLKIDDDKTDPKYFSNIQNDDNLIQFGERHIDLTPDLKNTKDKIWVTEFLSKNYTAKASFTIERNKKQQVPLENRYTVRLDNFHLVPLFANFEDGEKYYKAFDDIKSSNTKETMDNCQSAIDSLMHTKSSKKTCSTYFNGMQEYLTKESKTQPSPDACIRELIDYSKTNVADKNMLTDFQTLWGCMYQTKQVFYDSTNDQYRNYLCAFVDKGVDLNIATDSKSEMRKHSTLTANLITDALLKHIAKTVSSGNEQLKYLYTQAGGIPDVVVFNAGTFQESDETSTINYNMLLRTFSKDYDNSAKMALLSRNDLIKLIRKALTQSKNTTGAFPAVAGFHFSRTVTDNQDLNHTPIEVIKTKDIIVKDNGEVEFNRNIEYEEIYFLDDTIQNRIKENEKICVFNLQDKGECLIGEYEYKDGKYYADIRKNDDESYKIVYDPSKNGQKIKVLVTDYMAGGGDKFSEVLNLSNAEQFAYRNYYNENGAPIVLRDMFRSFFTDGNISDQNECHFVPGNHKEDVFSSRDLIGFNLVKRIYDYDESTPQSTKCVDGQAELKTHFSDICENK